MWSASARSLLLAGLALAGCGARSLDLAIAFDPACAFAGVPAGGSVQYLVSSSQATASSDGGGAGSFCGGCLPVASPLADPAAVLAFLRTHAPACQGVQPGSALLVRVNAFDGPDCRAGNVPLLCARSPAVTVPDGTHDARAQATLSCPQCSNAACVPTTCAQQGKDCDFISDGCSALLSCGTCKRPLTCGGSGTPNVCGR